MQRNIIFALTALVLLLAAALAIVLLRGESGQSGHAPVSINAADENVVEPLHDEMDCIDRLLQDNDLNANEVGPGLDRCRAAAGGNRSAGQ